MTTSKVEPIKTMKLYTNVDRVFNELREIGIGPNDPIGVEDLVPFDQYHYEGTGAVQDAIECCKLGIGSHVLEVGSGANAMHSRKCKASKSSVHGTFLRVLYLFLIRAHIVKYHRLQGTHFLN